MSDNQEPTLSAKRLTFSIALEIFRTRSTNWAER